MKCTTLATQSIGKTLLVLTLLLVILTPLTIQAQEAITLPPLTGDYAVGKIELAFTDQTRQEIFTDDPDDVRELMTSIYYPADATSDAQPAPYGNDALQADASTWPGIDSETWSLIETGILSEAPLAADQKTYPVILFSPGLGFLPLYYTSLLAEIASHGYVVISISRPYTTALTVFPDGRSVSANAAGLDVDPRRGDTFFDVMEKRERINAVWVADLRFILDQLEILNEEDSLLGGHLDLARIGVAGHSFGGSASAQAAYLDSRIGAVVSMDSSLDGEVAFQGFSQPYLLMEQADAPYEAPLTDEELAELGLTRDDVEVIILYFNHMRLLEGSSAGYRLRLEGSRHLTFATDIDIFAPYFPSITQRQVGTINGEQALQIITRYNVAFFDQHLKGQDSPLLDGATATDPEVLFETF